MGRLRKALVIEDTSFVQNSFYFYFYELGWDKPTIVSGGEEALRILQEGADAFDVVILDQRLPGISGVKTLAAARETVRNMPPVVMITGIEKAKGELEERGLSVDAFLLKNKFSKETLEELLARVLDKD